MIYTHTTTGHRVTVEHERGGDWFYRQGPALVGPFALPSDLGLHLAGKGYTTGDCGRCHGLGFTTASAMGVRAEGLCLDCVDRQERDEGAALLYAMVM